MPTPEDQIQPSETTMERDGFMRPRDAARDIGCGERWLRDGANHFGFPHTRMGKALWFSPDDRLQIRDMCHVPAQPGKARRRRNSGKKTAPAAMRNLSAA
ncbi:hypothetical protein [Streptomyces sp. NPDC051173]|uniref:hypothetical protein n=1 Tax=Streptomyces sp. NPDC051173 TaxID=3155164 RepID=UPI00344D2617